MKVEFPEFKRCCCCIPLRYGLLATGYIKILLVNVLLLVYFVLSTSYAIHLNAKWNYLSVMDILLLVVFAVLLLADTALTVVFLIGGHKKSDTLLRVYYKYSIVQICILLIIFIWTLFPELYYFGSYIKINKETMLPFTHYLKYKLIFVIGSIALNIYYILLIRSEMNKLRRNCNFRFTNVALEAECTMEGGIDRQIVSTDQQNNDVGNVDHTEVAREILKDDQMAAGAGEANYHDDSDQNTDQKENYKYNKLPQVY